MFKELNYRIIVVMVLVAMLFVAVTYFFSQQSYKRFASNIGISPESTTQSKAISESDTTKSLEQSKSTQVPKSINENVKVKPMVKSELANTKKERKDSAEKTEASEFDAASLMSTFGIPEEVKSLLDEDAEEADFEKA